MDGASARVRNPDRNRTRKTSRVRTLTFLSSAGLTMIWLLIGEKVLIAFRGDLTSSLRPRSALEHQLIHPVAQFPTMLWCWQEVQTAHGLMCGATRQRERRPDPHRGGGAAGVGSRGAAAGDGHARAIPPLLPAHAP